MKELEKTKGVKPAEIQHRKLDEIKSMPKMTKEEFVKEVQARPPAQVSEKVYAEPTKKDWDIAVEKLMERDAKEFVEGEMGSRTQFNRHEWDELFFDEMERLQSNEAEYLREIQTALDPLYRSSSNTYQFTLNYDLTEKLALTAMTSYGKGSVQTVMRLPNDGESVVSLRQGDGAPLCCQSREAL